jgi:hypothetical protein
LPRNKGVFFFRGDPGTCERFIFAFTIDGKALFPCARAFLYDRIDGSKLADLAAPSEILSRRAETG